MATYTKETALYDTGAIKGGIDNAAKTATNYLTAISGTEGISVHDAGDTDNFVNLNSEGVYVYKDGEQVAGFGENTVIGKDGEGQLHASAGGIRVTTESSESFVVSTSDGQKQVTVLKSLNAGALKFYNGMPSGTVKTKTLPQVTGIQWYEMKLYSLTYHYENVYTLPGNANWNYTGTGFTFQWLYSTRTITITSTAASDENIAFMFDRAMVTVTITAPMLAFGTRDSEAAKGVYSATFGEGLIGASGDQTVIGKYNVADTADGYAFIIGNGGGSSNRSNALAVDWNGNITGGTLNGVDISALPDKQDKVTGAASTITGSNLTASRALISNSSGKVAVSDVTSTELGYLDGVTSAIQTQLNAKLAASKVTVGSQTLSSTNIASGSNVNVGASGDIPVQIPAGKWVVTVTVRFNSNATGYRAAWLSTSSKGDAVAVAATSYVAAVNGMQTWVQFTYEISLSSATNYYVVAKQNSGSAIAAIGYVRWFGVAS